MIHLEMQTLLTLSAAGVAVQVIFSRKRPATSTTTHNHTQAHMDQNNIYHLQKWPRCSHTIVDENLLSTKIQKCDVHVPIASLNTWCWWIPMNFKPTLGVMYTHPGIFKTRCKPLYHRISFCRQTGHVFFTYAYNQLTSGLQLNRFPVEKNKKLRQLRKDHPETRWSGNTCTGGTRGKNVVV